MRRRRRQRGAELREMEARADGLLDAANAEAQTTQSETRLVRRLTRKTRRLEAHNQIAEIIRSGLGRSGA